MKIKSMTDVITNSSTEVFIMKASDFEKVMYKNPGLLSRKDFQTFTIIKTIDDLITVFREYPYLDLFSDLPEKSKRNLYEYKISGEAVYALKHFGHTDEEIKSYEDEVNKKREELRDADVNIQNLLDVAYGAWYDHSWGDLDKLMKYLDRNKIQYKYFGP